MVKVWLFTLINQEKKHVRRTVKSSSYIYIIADYMAQLQFTILSIALQPKNNYSKEREKNLQKPKHISH